VIVATGVDRALPRTPGFAELLGIGVHVGTPADLPATLRGREVIIAGPIVSASGAALRLSDSGGSVTVVTGEPLCTPGVSTSLRTALRARANVRVLSRTEIVCAAGVDRLESVVLQHTKTGRITALEAAALFLLLPGVPRTAWLPAGVARDTDGFVLTGAEVATMPDWPLARAPHPFETTLPGLFAAGEIGRGAPGGTAALTDGVATGRQVAALLRLSPSSQDLRR
jgi:thioredoxin reductase (NADPH)